MQDLKPLEPGVMFWGERDDLVEMKSLGERCGQLGIRGAMRLDEGAAAAWRDALRREDFTLVTVYASYIGESYADIPTVARTVGFVPKATREEREQRTRDVSDFAAALGVASIACHIANMILYGTGEPIAALRALAPWVVSVHCKDAWPPPADVHGVLGTERPLGQGSVGIERFVQTLREIGFRGPLNIEREAKNRQNWIGLCVNPRQTLYCPQHYRSNRPPSPGAATAAAPA